MAGHAGLAGAIGTRIFFTNPHAPRQRGANQNTNPLLRQYVPKGRPCRSSTKMTSTPWPTPWTLGPVRHWTSRHPGST